MTKQSNYLSKALSCLLITLTVCSPNMAHSGRTDSAGGHKDKNNVSGLGSYHYHHGYGPHLHNGGCPYESKQVSSNTSTSNTSSSKPNVTKLKQQAEKQGYDVGFKDAYSGNIKSSSHKSDYTEQYTDGYNNGYEQGIAKLTSEKELHYGCGYNDGVTGKMYSVVSDNSILMAEYKKGFDVGENEYIATLKKQYTLLGENDASSFLDKKVFEENIHSEAALAYTSSYDAKLSKMESDVKNIAFNDAILDVKNTSLTFNSDVEEKWYEDGYSRGKELFLAETTKAFNCGYTGEEFAVNSELKDVENDVMAYYEEGVNLRNKEKVNSTLAGIGLIALTTSVSAVIINKNKKRKSIDNIEELTDEDTDSTDDRDNTSNDVDK